MTKAANIEAIEKATGKTWEQWLIFLKRLNAQALPHKEIAQKVVHEGGVSGWWAQAITVAYEQEIGRRIPGQRSNGKFQVTVSKTVDGSMDEALQKWLEVINGRTQFSDVPVKDAPTTSKSDKFRYWHCSLTNGSRLSMSIYEKAGGKSVIGLGHENLKSEDQVEHWRAYWKSLFAKLA